MGVQSPIKNEDKFHCCHLFAMLHWNCMEKEMEEVPNQSLISFLQDGVQKKIVMLAEKC